MKKLERLKKVLAFIRGDFIVLQIDRDSERVVVDAGNSTKRELLAAASVFFKATYNQQQLSRQT